MSSIKVDKGSAATVQRSGIAAFKEPLQCFFRIVQSCRTPNGRIQMLQSSSGGNITLTSSSKRLLSNLSVRKPVIQLLVSAAQGHLDAYSDCGLFLTSFAADLVLKSMNSNQNLKILAECYEMFLTLCLQYLDSDFCQFKYSAIISNLMFMQSYVKSILMSKPLCALDKERLSHISSIVIDLFLRGVTDGDLGKHVADSLHVVSHSGLDVMKSARVNGLVIHSPELSKFQTQTIHPKKTHFENNFYVKVALIEVSLSGDLEEVSGVNYEVTTDISWDSVILEGLSNFCDSLIQSDVGLVLCQKVIHPRLKVQLRKSGLIVVDRVGSYPMKLISTVSGCKPILSVKASISDGCYGFISDVKHEIINKQSYLLLTKTNNPVSTLFLCHNQDEALNELKDVCMTCIDSLQQLLYTPYVLAGGSCWQTGLATYLQSKVCSEAEVLSGELDVPISVIKAAGVLFSDSLIETTLGGRHSYAIDSATGHACMSSTHPGDYDRVTQYCCCQLYKVCYENECLGEQLDGSKLVPNLLVSDTDIKDALRNKYVVLDGYRPAVNAFQTAVLAACSILKIGQVVENI